MTTIQTIDSNHRLTAEGLKHLSAHFEGNANKCRVFGIVGKYRGGKSSLLNLVVSRLTSGTAVPASATSSPLPFAVAHTINAETRGIYFHEPAEGIVLLDTEGLASFEVGEETDVRLVASVLALCTDLVLNVHMRLSQADLRLLQDACSVAKRAGLLGSSGDQWPRLHCLLRDFQAALSETPTDYVRKICSKYGGLPFSEVLGWTLPPHDHPQFQQSVFDFTDALIPHSSAATGRKSTAQPAQGSVARSLLFDRVCTVATNFGVPPDVEVVRECFRASLAKPNGETTYSAFEANLREAETSCSHLLFCDGQSSVKQLVGDEMRHARAQFEDCKERSFQQWLQHQTNYILAAGLSSSECGSRLSQVKASSDQWGPNWNMRLRQMTENEISRREHAEAEQQAALVRQQMEQLRRQREQQEQQERQRQFLYEMERQRQLQQQEAQRRQQEEQQRRLQKEEEQRRQREREEAERRRRDRDRDLFELRLPSDSDDDDEPCGPRRGGFGPQAFGGARLIPVGGGAFVVAHGGGMGGGYHPGMFGFGGPVGGFGMGYGFHGPQYY